MTESSPISPIRGTTSREVGQDLRSIRTAQARKAAIKLEASFLAEMLKSAGLGKTQGGFGGGIGEEQFASFHREAIARRMAEAGGIGLAEHFFRAIMETQDEP